ncbi:MAG: hypothetical protein PHU25_17885 [Deltaproteobacteria bacterium]|nr:hypothetical protein [Deltaproteobacteria bacterium]
MRPIRTLEDINHAVTNSLSLISSHSQYLLGKQEEGTPGKDELQIIYEEAERAASLLSLVPQGLARIPIQDPPPADLRAGGRRAGAGDASHGKGQR